MVEQALKRFARIDCLVNDAGVFIGKPFTDYTLDDYVLITSVNLAGFFHLTQRVIGQMVTQGSGHVVNVTTSLVDHRRSKTPPRCLLSPRAVWPPSHARWRLSTHHAGSG